MVARSGEHDRIFWFLIKNSLHFFPKYFFLNQDLERKQALAKKQDRNSNDEDRAPPSLEDLKRRGISFSHNLIMVIRVVEFSSGGYTIRKIFA